MCVGTIRKKRCGGAQLTFWDAAAAAIGFYFLPEKKEKKSSDHLSLVGAGSGKILWNYFLLFLH
jgi:hypothetical protein